jgi:tRNA(fMet)-specific endonuclease VapC
VNKAVLDTDIFSEVLKGIDPHVARKAAAYRAAFSRYTITTLTVLEIVKGLHKQKQAKKLKQFLSHLSAAEVLPLDQTAAEIAGRIYADLARTGQPIGRIDPMIAGIALRQGLVLVTGNTDHYRRVQALGYKLELDNWRRP